MPDPKPVVGEPPWLFKEEFDRMHAAHEDLLSVIHLLLNAVNALSLKTEVILTHIRRRGE